MQNLLHILTLVGAIQGTLFGLVLFQLPGGNRLANRLLALFLLFFSICMLGIVAYASHWVLQTPYLALLHTPVGAVQGAPLLLYILALSQKDFRIRWFHGVLLLPFLVVLIWLIPFYGLPAAEKLAALEASYTEFPPTWKNIFIFSNLCNFGYIIASFVAIQRHERVIREVYSSPLNKTLTWTRNFLIGGTVIFLVCVFMGFNDITWADSLSNFNFSILIYVFGYRAMRQPDIFGDVGIEAIPDPDKLSLIRSAGKYEKSGLPESKVQDLLGHLEQLMTEEKIFLDPSLNLQQLSQRLGIPPHQLSQLLNQYKGESFSDFVNDYRVAYFKKAVADPANAHFSLLAIAFESGFNSKAAFNAVFKRVTGSTPSDFVKQIR